MRHRMQSQILICRFRGKALTMVLVFIVGLVVLPGGAMLAVGQTYTVLHNFTGPDGSEPLAGVTLENAGNLYGTTLSGGPGHYGVVYKLKRQGSGYLYEVLYGFTGHEDGYAIHYGIAIGPDGRPYGAATQSLDGYGNVFTLSPPATFCRTVSCPWSLTLLHTFTGRPDGSYPGMTSKLVFDGDGSIYGNTPTGGAIGYGTIYQLTNSILGWQESVLYSFGGYQDGSEPWHNVVIGNDGSLYGTTYSGGLYPPGDGTVFQLSPSPTGWVKTILASFSRTGPEGGFIQAGLITDAVGNLYGATSGGGSGGGGTVFEVSPSANGWVLQLLYSFSGDNYWGPAGNMVMDPEGNLYGTTVKDGAYGAGSIFELTPSSDGLWNYSTLYNFTGALDGAQPMGDLVRDANGTLYGTTSGGGTGYYGVVWKYQP